MEIIGYIAQLFFMVWWFWVSFLLANSYVMQTRNPNIIFCPSCCAVIILKLALTSFSALPFHKISVVYSPRLLAESSLVYKNSSSCWYFYNFTNDLGWLLGSGVKVLLKVIFPIECCSICQEGNRIFEDCEESIDEYWDRIKFRVNLSIQRHKDTINVFVFDVARDMNLAMQWLGLVSWATCPQIVFFFIINK